MNLLTKEIVKRFKKLGSQENIKDPIVVCKFFNPVGRGNWFPIEYNEDEGLFFGYVSLFGDYNDELGYFYLDELKDINLPFGMSIERDRFFSEKPLSEVKKEYTK